MNNILLFIYFNNGPTLGAGQIFIEPLADADVMEHVAARGQGAQVTLQGLSADGALLLTPALLVTHEDLILISLVKLVLDHLLEYRDGQFLKFLFGGHFLDCSVHFPEGVAGEVLGHDLSKLRSLKMILP